LKSPCPDAVVVLADQVKCIDWKFRAQPKDTAPDEVIKAVRVLLGALLQI
jgi:mRNA-degrading endonuclease toxin of MazEF toxin-antitoxin module